MMRAVFSKPYSGVTEADLQVFCTNVVKRMYLLKKFFPPRLAVLLRSVLAHHNLSDLDRSVAAL